MDSANTSISTNDFVGAGFKTVFQNSQAPLPPREPNDSGVTSSAPPGSPPVSPPPSAPVFPPVVSAPETPPPSLSGVTSFVVPGKMGTKKEKKGFSGKSVMMIGFLVLLLGGLVVSFGKIRSFISSAAGTCSPENLAEANLTSNSMEIVFQTGKACQMEVAYGISSQALLLQVPETMASLSHRIRLTPLLPSTTYYYQLIAEGKKIGTVRSFLTKAPVTTIPTEEPEAPAVVKQVVPTTVPTTVSVIPTQSASSSATVKTYTYEDFKGEFGGINPTFDIDKNGVVNRADWLLYQKTNK